jgi:type III pantothenate kinase
LKILAVDIGNTNIVVGVFEAGKLISHWRIATRKRSTPDEYSVLLSALFAGSRAKSGSLDSGPFAEGVIVSCVVPSLVRVLLEALKPYHKGAEIVIGPGVKTGMKILTDDPREVGADRIVNAVAAYDRGKGPVIVVDFGTAITFDHITGEGEYSGGLISPGVTISMDALFQRAARLPRVEFTKPERLVGKSTIESLKSGIFYGYVGMVEGIVKKMKEETGPETFVIATGGVAPLIGGDCPSIDEVDEFLTLEGLKLIYGINS